MLNLSEILMDRDFIFLLIMTEYETNMGYGEIFVSDNGFTTNCYQNRITLSNFKEDVKKLDDENTKMYPVDTNNLSKAVVEFYDFWTIKNKTPEKMPVYILDNQKDLLSIEFELDTPICILFK